MNLSTEEIIAIVGIVVTVLIALLGGIYGIVTSTKKYELTEQYRRELLQWYSDVITLMAQIIHACENETFSSAAFSAQRTDMLANLFALSEVGRFYFPNVLKKDGFGDEKPSAYRGYRHINLEFMRHFYNIASSDGNDRDKTERLRKLERQFTSGLFDMVDPRTRNRRYSKYLEISIPRGKSIEDFLDDSPDSFSMFWTYPASRQSDES